MTSQHDANATPTPPRDPAHSPSPVSQPPRPRRWRGTVVALVLVGLVGWGAWYLVQRSTQGSGGPGGAGASGAPRGAGGPGGPGGPGGAGPRSSAMQVTVGMATAQTRKLPTLIDALGTVTPAVVVTLRPQVSGLLSQVLFTEGQMVKKGQLLAQIDPKPFEQALLQARGTRLKDEAQLDNARITLERYRTLLSQDSIARQDVDTQAALVKQLEGTVLTDKAQENAAQLNLDYTRITAPVAGRIGLRAVDPGNYVATGDANGVAVITQVTPIDVVFTVPQDRVADVLAAQSASEALTVTALNRTRANQLGQGQFSTLDNQVDTTTGTVRAKARFDNANGALFPNQFVNVQLLLANVPSVVVPVTALRVGSTGDFVFVINENRTVSKRKVTRGQATVQFVAIAEGLKEGERVVTEGGDRLQDGMTVQLPGAPAQGAAGARGPGGGASGAAGAAGGASGAQPGQPAGEGRRQRPAQAS